MPFTLKNTSNTGTLTLRNNSGVGRFSMSVSVDADAQAFFVRVTAAGGTLSATEQTAINQLVLDLKANNIWTSMLAIYPMVGSSAAACAQNLKSSSFTGTFSGGWTYASTGVTGNGTNAYMNTGINSSTVLSLNNTHFSVYLRTNTDGTYVDLGLFTGTPPLSGINIFARLSNMLYMRLNEEDSNTVASSDSRGFKLGVRNNSTTKNIFNNNTKTAFTASSVNLINGNILIGAMNDLTLGIRFYSIRENAFTSIGSGLSDTDASNFYTAVQAFQTTLSRQV
jgi:hypothetical protein